MTDFATRLDCAVTALQETAPGSNVYDRMLTELRGLADEAVGPKYPKLVVDRGREWALEAETKLLDLHNNVLLSHQSIDLLEQVLDARRTLNACPKCGSIRDEPCLSGGYLPVGELPGDPIKKPHRQRSARR